MTDTAIRTDTMPHPLHPLRLAWLARNAWYRVSRPLTMGVRAVILKPPAAPGAAAQVLLIRHSYVGGWHLPGGGVDKGETLVAAMRREVREEVGLEVECPPQPHAMYAHFRHGASDHVALFVVERWSGTPRADRFEIVEAAFHPLDALPRATTPATRRRLAELHDGAPPSEHW